MSVQPVWLVELQAWTGAGVETLRLSSGAYCTLPGDTPSNTAYQDRIIDPGYLETSLFGAGRTMGAATVSHGEITVSNADGALDGWLAYGIDGRALTIKRLANGWSAYSAAETVFSGTAEALDATGDALTTLRIRLYDRRLDLDQQIQTTRYGGTVAGSGASADGGPDLKDTVKPLVFGKVFKVPAVPANTHDLIYQVSDGAVSAISVYDAGVALTGDGDAADLAALQGATIAGGKYKTCLALGLFRLGGSPYKTVTADVTEGATAADRTAAQVVSRMLAKMGFSGSDLDSASVTALDASATDEAGIFIGAERNGLGACQAVLASAGGWIVTDPATGKFSLGRLAAPGTSAATYTDRQVAEQSLRVVRVTDEGGGLPAYRVNLTYRKQWHQYGEGDVAELLAAETRAALAQEWKTVQAEDAAVLTQHLLAPELTVETLLADETEAGAEAARRLVLYKASRLLLQFDLPFEEAGAAVLGATVTLDLPRLGLDGGRAMRVLGRRDSLRDNMVTLTVWG